MKRLLSVLVCVCLLLVSVGALASEVDLSGLDADRLQAVMNDAAQRLHDARAVESDGTYPLTFSGDGTDIVTDIELNGDIPFRVSYTQEGKGGFEVSYMLSGNTRSLMDSSSATNMQAFVSKAGTYDFVVESDNPWTITIEPLGEGGAIDLSGTGNYVSDIFTVNGATIIEITGNTGEAWYMGVSAHAFTKYGLDKDVLLNELPGSNEDLATKKVLKFSSETRMFFEVNNPVGTWSIKALGK